MGILVRNRAQYHQSGLMEVVQQRRGVQLGSFNVCEQQLLLAEPRLPSGWEKCLDLKSGLIYFKDWNSGTLTYRDPRHQSVSLATQQRIGLLSISTSTTTPADEQALRTSTDEEGVGTKRKSMDRFTSDEQSLELSLNLPGTRPRSITTGSSQEGSVCTMEKVRSALERSQWLHTSSRTTRLNKNVSNHNNNRISTVPGTAGTGGSDDPTTTLSLLSSSSSLSSSCSRLLLESRSISDSAATSQCSSECFTSPSVMSFQGNDEEVQQPGEGRDSGAKGFDNNSAGVPGGISSPAGVMVTVGCKSCLMYVMLCKSHPSCPKCGNTTTTTDVLLQLPPAPPLPLPKKKPRTTLALQSQSQTQTPSWSWCTA